MVRLFSGGPTLSALYELDTNLEQVIAELGLKPLSSEAEEKIRFGVGAAIGRWLDEHKAFDNVETVLMADELRPREKQKKKVMKLRVRDLKATLNAMASGVELAVRVLRSGEGGVVDDFDLRVRNEVRRFLSMNPESGGEDNVDGFLSEFCNKGEALSRACRIAIADIDAELGHTDSTSRKVGKGKGGAPRLDWYADFVYCISPIAEQNGIGLAGQGRFVDICLRLRAAPLPRNALPQSQGGCQEGVTSARATELTASGRFWRRDRQPCCDYWFCSSLPNRRISDGATCQKTRSQRKVRARSRRVCACGDD
jgi:hypothetical protein